MSLDIYLRLPANSETGGDPTPETEERIFIREGGQNKEISREEFYERFPGCEPVAFVSPRDDIEVFTANITHNLNRMAEACGLYDVMWNPDENGWTHAEDLIPRLRYGLTKLVTDPLVYKDMNPENGWGDYGLLLQTASDLLDACLRWPRAEVSVWK